MLEPIRQAWLIWALVWLILFLIEWRGQRRMGRLARYGMAWLAGAAILSAAALILPTP
jgi:hypothetical protein